MIIIKIKGVDFMKRIFVMFVVMSVLLCGCGVGRLDNGSLETDATTEPDWVHNVPLITRQDFVDSFSETLGENYDVYVLTEVGVSDTGAGLILFTYTIVDKSTGYAYDFFIEVDYNDSVRRVCLNDVNSDISAKGNVGFADLTCCIYDSVVFSSVDDDSNVVSFDVIDYFDLLSSDIIVNSVSIYSYTMLVQDVDGEGRSCVVYYG